MQIKKVRALKQGTKFISYNAKNEKQVCIVRTKRGSFRDIEIEGKEGTYSIYCDDKVEVIESVKK